MEKKIKTKQHKKHKIFIACMVWLHAQNFFFGKVLNINKNLTFLKCSIIWIVIYSKANIYCFWTVILVEIMWRPKYQIELSYQSVRKISVLKQNSQKLITSCTLYTISYPLYINNRQTHDIINSYCVSHFKLYFNVNYNILLNKITLNNDSSLSSSASL